MPGRTANRQALLSFFSILVIQAVSHAVPPPSAGAGRVVRDSPQVAEAPAAIVRADAATASGPAYPAVNVDLLSHVTLAQFSQHAQFGVGSGNDVWGYVSPSGREYAIMGLQAGTGFVDITDPVAPVIVGVIPDANSIWSDMKTYQQYAYNANESGGGLQIIDLGSLDKGTVSLAATFQGNMLSTSHTLAVNQASGFLYLCGSNISGGRLVALSLATPRAPTVAGIWNDSQSQYVHAAQVVTYTEGVYAGREIAFCYCGRNGLRIVDVTNKANMFTMSILYYIPPPAQPGQGYCHQGWLSEDWRHIFIDDELDESELPQINTTTTYVVNVEDLSNPTYVTQYTNGLPSIDHNLMVRGQYVYEANYTSGLRVYDASDVMAMQERGSLDTYPGSNGQNFNGAWGVFSQFPSRVVIVGDQSGGLFVADVAGAAADSCLVPAPPFPLVNAVANNRYLSIRPGNSGRQTAIRVVLADLPPPFEAFEGQEMWVDAPVVHPGGLVTAALRCDPLYRDWAGTPTVHITGAEIVPGATYDLQTYEEQCVQGPQLRTSALKTFPTVTAWGDVIGPTASGPLDGMADFADISEVVSVFVVPTGPISIVRSDLVPSVPDQVVNFQDVSAAVDAFRNLPYPFAGPSSCF